MTIETFYEINCDACGQAYEASQVAARSLREELMATYFAALGSLS